MKNKIRKILFLLYILILCLQYTFGQKTNSKPKDTLVFSNNAKLYRQFNKDSMWLTFQLPNQSEKIMYSLKKNLMHLSYKIGYQFIKEYSTSLLFINKQASGGGFPVHYELLNKNNGKILKKLGAVLYYSQSNSTECIVTFKKDSLPKLKFYFIKSGITKEYPIFKKSNALTRYLFKQLFPENRFKNAQLQNNIFSIQCTYKKDSSNTKWLSKTIYININSNP